MSLPEHERTSPVNPALQVQLCPPNGVGAVCIHVTVVVAGDTFIDIYIAND